jgi:long-chain acyl-CoA synthetase
VTLPRSGPDGQTLDGPTFDARDAPASLLALVERSVQRAPSAVAMRWLDPKTGGWCSMAYAELWDRVRDASLGLATLGVGRGDRVIVFGRSRPEWAIADMAILALGAVTCPIFDHEGPLSIGDIVRRVGARVAFVESDAEATLLREAGGGDTPGEIIAFEPPTEESGIRTLASLEDAGASVSTAAREAWEAGWRTIGPETVATVVHALGFRGELVGAMLTHGNVLHNFAMAVPALRLTDREVVLSVLPLSHMLERGTGLYVPLGLGATVAYAPPRTRRWTDVLRQVRPTAMVAVPLLLDRLADGIRDEIRRQPRWRRALLHRAIRLESRRRRQPRSPWRRPLVGVARFAVTGRIRANLGGRLRFIACGGSALRPRTGRFLTMLGVPVVEGYGLTEAAPLVSLNDLDDPRFGTIGRPLAGTTVRIEPTRGEILVRGPQVMCGYLHDPSATHRALDADGWLHTGDLGRFDADGRLVITGRLKPLVVLATGKKVARHRAEEALRGAPLIRDVSIVGDGEPAVRALVTVDPDQVRAAGLDGDASALRRVLEREVQLRLQGWSRYEQPRVIEIR